MARWKNISVEDAESMLLESNMLVFDVRDKRSYLLGHYPNALHLGDSNLRRILKYTAQDLPILFYCDHGHASQDMATLFADFGFSQCYSLQGGYEAWTQSLCQPRCELQQPLVDWIIECGYDPRDLDYRGRNNETVLMQSAREGVLWVCEQLLEAGASVNLKNADGNNALWMAAIRGDHDIIMALAKAGIDVDNQNDHGATALIYAASRGRRALVKTLLSCGANPTLTTHDGFTPLDVAGDLPTLKLLKNCLSDIHADVQSPLTV